MSRHPSGVPETWENPAFGYQYLHAVADLEIPTGDTFGKVRVDHLDDVADLDAAGLVVEPARRQGRSAPPRWTWAW